LILKEKKVREFFWAIEVPKKISKHIKKTPFRRVAQKKYTFAPGAANHTFLTHPVSTSYYLLLF